MRGGRWRGRGGVEVFYCCLYQNKINKCMKVFEDSSFDILLDTSGPIARLSFAEGRLAEGSRHVVLVGVGRMPCSIIGL